MIDLASLEGEPQFSRCRCGKSFFAHPGLTLCPRCRRRQLRIERGWNLAEMEREQRELAILMRSQPREEWDVRIIDECGREVWARDLAKRYRAELGARAGGDYRQR